MKSFRVISHSAAQTRSWAKRLGKFLDGGEIIGLTGELGSGKTCFVRGLAEGLEVGKEVWVRSPSFTLINEYEGRLPLFHIDLFRLSDAAEIEDLDLREYLFSRGVSAIEWFDHLPGGDLEEYLHVDLEHVDPRARWLTFTAHGSGYEEMLDRLTRGRRLETEDRVS